MDDNNNMIPDLSAEDSSHLHELIQLSYPAPKTDIREQVMAEIARAAKRKARINRMVRYGGVAACFVLIAAIVITIAPMLNRTSKDAVMEAEAEICNVTATSDYSNTISDVEVPQYITYTTGTDDAGPTDCFVQSSLYAAAGSTKNGNNAEHATEAAVPEAAEKAAPPNNECSLYLEKIADADLLADSCFSCTIHGSAASSSYHVFCEELIAYVGEAEFDAWYGSAEALDECGIPSVRRMVEYFGIDRDTFAAIAEGSSECYILDQIFPQ